MNIPESAIEAAARALDPQAFDYTALTVRRRSAFQSLARDRARAALEAAAPEIARAAKAEVFDEAVDLIEKRGVDANCSAVLRGVAAAYRINVVASR